MDTDEAMELRLNRIGENSRENRRVRVDITLAKMDKYHFLTIRCNGIELDRRIK